jgi:hypothetical protein
MYQARSENAILAEALASGNDLYDLQPITGVDLAAGKLRRRHRLAVVLDDHAAREEALGDQELLDRARKLGYYRPAISGDVGSVGTRGNFGCIRHVALTPLAPHPSPSTPAHSPAAG